MFRELTVDARKEYSLSIMCSQQLYNSVQYTKSCCAAMGAFIARWCCRRGGGGNNNSGASNYSNNNSSSNNGADSGSKRGAASIPSSKSNAMIGMIGVGVSGPNSSSNNINSNGSHNISESPLSGSSRDNSSGNLFSSAVSFPALLTTYSFRRGYSYTPIQTNQDGDRDSVSSSISMRYRIAIVLLTCIASGFVGLQVREIGDVEIWVVW